LVRLAAMTADSTEYNSASPKAGRWDRWWAIQRAVQWEDCWEYESAERLDDLAVGEMADLKGEQKAAVKAASSVVGTAAERVVLWAAS